MLQRLLVGVVVVSVMQSGAAAAWPLEDALAAYERGDYVEALRTIGPLAEDGNATAQFTLGTIYAKGQGVTQDFTEAEKWLRRAAEQGNVLSQYSLGLVNDTGLGVAQDDAEAVRWYRRAAEQGNAEAQYYLGKGYADGQGVSRNYVLAHMWLSLALAQDLPFGFNAVAQDLPLGFNHVASFLDLLAEDMTPDQITEAQRLAREWKPKVER